MRPLTLTAILLLTVTSISAQVQTQTLGLQVGSTSIEQLDFSIRPYTLATGTRVHLLLSGFEQSIVKLDDKASTLTRATDSTGKDLLTKPEVKKFSVSMSSSPIGPFPRVSEDGKQLIVTLIAPQTPAPGATSFALEGSFSVLVASGKKKVKADNITLEPTKVQLGEHTLEVTKFAASQWDESKFELTVKMTTTLHDQIASFQVKDAQGKILCDGPTSTMTMNQVIELGLPFESKPTGPVIFELELYDGMQRVEVPINLKVGLGLSIE